MSHRLVPPPPQMRKAKLDNLALLPASGLAQIARYQAIANELPEGGVLIVLPANSPEHQEALLAVARLLADHGHEVRVISRREPPRRPGSALRAA